MPRSQSKTQFETKRLRLFVFFLALSLGIPFTVVPGAQAQQTLGGITGTVMESTGSVLPGTVVTIVGDETTLTRTQTSNGNGSYDFVNLPIGAYTLTFTHEGFQTQRVPSILVQANRTATVNATMQVGQVATTITVEETPLVNSVDTTNGYILDRQQIETVPLPTGSFTGLAILSPGVNAELPAGTGANAGLGNQPIWANGQRDTSNSFLLNGVDASNLFNGKSTSQVASARIVNNTGVAGAGSTTAADHSEHGVALSGDRPGAADPGSGDGSGISREHFDVRRATGLHQRRPHRHEHVIRNKFHSRRRPTFIAGRTG